MHSAATCPNCDAALPQDPPAKHCPACGQETHLHPPTFGEFLHEFIGHYVALEGALWRTLGLLLFRPGQLTLEYLRGRRRRYVLPLRVYISASFVFFFAVKVLGVGTDVVGTSAEVKIDAESRARMEACAARSPDCEWVEQRVSALVLRMHAKDGGPAASVGTLRERMVAWAPYAMFAMQPVFAALVMLGWRRRRLTYGVHFVFSLHIHAFWFLALLAMAALPAGGADVGLLLITGYTLWALRTVYGGRWWVTALRGLALLLCYSMLLLLLVVVAMLGVLAS